MGPECVSGGDQVTELATTGTAAATNAGCPRDGQCGGFFFRWVRRSFICLLPALITWTGPPMLAQ
jgi:hypothetical protein